MDIRRITDRYAVSPQIGPEDVPALAEAGFTTVICNRPDDEVGPGLMADEVAAAARAAGLDWVLNPVGHAGLSQDMIDRQRSALAAAPGPVLAYCRSGTRSTIVWAIGEAGTRDGADIIADAARAGYDIAHLAPILDDTGA